LALNILNHTNIKYKDVTGSGAKQINFSEVEINKATEYASEDADIALQLHQHFYPLLQQDEKLFSVYNTIELPLVNVLTKMENKGVLINSELLLTQSKELEITLEKLSNNIFNAVDQVFNLDSPKQLQDILFNKLGLPVLEKTPTGQPSTGESVLQDLALNYPVVNDILEYRGLKKLKSTYTDTLPDQINQHTGRIHTSYQQAVTATGRLSSTNPNLQNIPVKTAEGRRIRQAFIASKDHVLISCDYSQIELRIMAHLSKDKGLITAFSKDQDIHNFTAAWYLNTF
jgi:DNA polymerase-1